MPYFANRQHPAPSTDQNQQHKRVGRYFPLALDCMSVGGDEPESRVVIWVAHNDNEWAALILESSIPASTSLVPIP